MKAENTTTVENLPDALLYRRGQFTVTLPKSYRYTAGHLWIAPAADSGLWRAGFTKFASRLLGEPVEIYLNIQSGAHVTAGDVIGWYEGLKARTDLYSAMDGTFHEINPELEEDCDITWTDPHDRGWLYKVQGVPDENSVDVHGYIDILNATLVKLQANKTNDCEGLCVLCDCHAESTQTNGADHDACDCECDCKCQNHSAAE